MEVYSTLNRSRDNLMSETQMRQKMTRNDQASNMKRLKQTQRAYKRQLVKEIMAKEHRYF